MLQDVQYKLKGLLPFHPPDSNGIEFLCPGLCLQFIVFMDFVCLNQTEPGEK